MRAAAGAVIVTVDLIFAGRNRILKGFDQFYLAVPARADHVAEILIYTVQD